VVGGVLAANDRERFRVDHGEPRSHRVRRDVENLGDLGTIEILPVGQLERDLMIRAGCGAGLVKQALLLGARDGAARDVPRSATETSLTSSTRRGCNASVIVEQTPSRDRESVARKLWIGEVRQKVEECLLDQVSTSCRAWSERTADRFEV